MWAVMTCPFSSCTRNMVFGKVSWTVPSISMTSSFAMCSGSDERPEWPHKSMSMPQPALASQPGGGSGELFVELLADFFFDRALQRRQEHAQFGRDVHIARRHGDRTFDARTLEGEGVAIPAAFGTELFTHAIGHAFDHGARLGHGLGVRAADIDLRHEASSSNGKRRSLSGPTSRNVDTDSDAFAFKQIPHSAKVASSTSRFLHAHRIRQLGSR